MADYKLPFSGNEILNKLNNVDTLENSVTELKSDLDSLTNINYLLIDGKYVSNLNGNALTYNGYKYTDFIYIEPLEKIIVGITSITNNVGLAFYSDQSLSGFISGVNYADFSIGDKALIEVPNNAKYMRASVLTSNIDKFGVWSTGVFNGLFNTNEKINDVNINTNARINDALKIDLGAIVDGFVNSVSGSFLEATTYKRTDYIPIIGGAVDVCVTYNVDNVGLAFYDKNKIYIDGHDYEGHAYGDIVRIEVPQNAKYLAYCAINNQKDNMRISYPQLAKSVIQTISNDTKNPCEYTESKECIVFNKILCIGDSLTDGQFDYKVDGVTKEFNDKRYAYPTYLKALTGRDITNVGDAGESTVSWFELHGTEDFSGHDACIIALGRNDEIAEISTEARVNAMNNIIAKVKADNPQIKIFICTQINYYHYSIVDTINADMATVVEQNIDCYLLDIHTYGSMVFANDAHSHCTAVGYYKLAQEIFNYISYVMHNNPTEFKTIQFSGTDRSY